MSMNHLHNNFLSKLNHGILNHGILFAFQRVKTYLNLLHIYNYINESLYKLTTSKSKYPFWSINCLYCWILLRVALVTSMEHERFRKDTIDSVTFFSGQIWKLSQRASTAGAPLLMSTKSFWFSIWSVAGNKNQMLPALCALFSLFVATFTLNSYSTSFHKSFKFVFLNTRVEIVLCSLVKVIETLWVPLSQ